MLRLCVAVVLLALFTGCVGQSFNKKAALEVREGMTEVEVEQLIGKPLWKAPYEKDPRVVTWGYFHDNMVRATRLQVIFCDGVVIQAPSSVATTLKESSEQQLQNQRTFEEGAEKRRRQEHVEANQGLSDRIKDCVLTGKICLGMSEADVRASWGPPKRVNTTVDATGQVLQMVYGDPLTTGTFVYVRNGAVSSWQSHNEE